MSSRAERPRHNSYDADGGRAKNCENSKIKVNILRYIYMSDLEKWAIEQAKLYGLLDEYLECRLRGYSILADLAEHQATGHALGRHTRAEALTGTHIVNIFHSF